MSSAIIRNGRWRRRDPVAGLSPAMLAAVRALHNAGFFGCARPTTRTVRALAERGLIRRAAGPDGREIVAELGRRAAARRALIAEKPARGAAIEGAP